MLFIRLLYDWYTIWWYGSETQFWINTCKKQKTKPKDWFSLPHYFNCMEVILQSLIVSTDVQFYYLLILNYMQGYNDYISKFCV